MINQPPVSGTQVLTADRCWGFLREATVGRLAFVLNGKPEIYPVNFVVDHGSMVFRTDNGRKLLALADGGEVAFEADGTTNAGAAAWSVIVKGRAVAISRTDDLLDTVFLPLHPWENGTKERFVRVTPETITGRLFSVAGLAVWQPPLDSATRAGAE